MHAVPAVLSVPACPAVHPAAHAATVSHGCCSPSGYATAAFHALHPQLAAAAVIEIQVAAAVIVSQAAFAGFESHAVAAVHAVRRGSFPVKRTGQTAPMQHCLLLPEH